MGFALADLAFGVSGNQNYAGQANAAERQRQASINSGLAQIDAVFDGGKAPIYSLATGSFDPKQSYYKVGKKGDYVPYYQAKQGGQFSPNSVPGNPDIVGGVFDALGLFDSHQPSLKSDITGKIKHGKLYTKSEQDFQGFGAGFYKQREKAYTDFALPQVADQFRQSRNAVGYGLANRGLIGSSTAGQQYSNLNRQADQAKRNVADTALGQSQTLQRQISDTKNTLISQLYQGADPARALQGSISAAASFQQPSVFAPVANSFSGFLNQYYLNSVLSQRQAPTPIQTYPQSLSSFGGSLPPIYSSTNG